MTTYSDGIGNHFIGNVGFSNYNNSFPDAEFFVADELTNFSADLTSICTSAGLLFRNVISQSVIDDYLANATLNGAPNLSRTLLHFGPAGDINDRFGIGIHAGASSGSITGGGPVSLYNNSGSTNTSNTIDESTNLLCRAGFNTGVYGINGGIRRISFSKAGVSGGTFSPIYYCGVANSSSLALYITQFRYSNASGQAGIFSQFSYAGIMSDLNTTSSYYNASVSTSAVIFSGGYISSDNTTVMPTINGRHHIGGTSKFPLETNDALYPITCSGNQMASHAYIFDNDPSRNYPCMGRAPNLMLANGYYVVGKPVKILSSTPDAGQNSWLPVGVFGGKTMLMRCYSTNI